MQDDSGDVDNTSGNVLGDAVSGAESFYGSAVTSQKSKTEVGGLLRPLSAARVRFGRKNVEYVAATAEEEPLYPESFPVNSTHRGTLGGDNNNQRDSAVRWDSSAAAGSDNNYGDDEDSATMVSRHKSKIANHC